MACFLLIILVKQVVTRESQVIHSYYKKNQFRLGCAMTDYEKQVVHQQQEMVTIGMAFMGFLMGVGAILGMWFLTGLLQVLSKMMG